MFLKTVSAKPAACRSEAEIPTEVSGQSDSLIINTSLLPAAYCPLKIFAVFVRDVKIFVVKFCIGTGLLDACLADLVSTVFADYT